MARRKFVHEFPESRTLIEQLSKSRETREQLVEKDYWLMHALWGLQQQEFEFALKGGTSLSKGFEIIDRFSEDIDIKIEPLDSLDVKTGKNQDKPKQIASRINFYNWLADEIKIPGVRTERDVTFDDKDGRNGGIRLNFESVFPKLEAIKTYVLLEVGFDVTTPNEKRTISSWVHDAAVAAGLDVKDNRAVGVACYLPGYTFVEKLSAISGKYQKEQEGKLMPVNFIRHYYDVYQLLGEKSVLNFIGTEAYLKHKASTFRKRTEQDLTKNEAFILSSSATRAKYAKEYQRTQVLYYGGFPSFDGILERIHSYLGKL
jgi:hypothetical protein